MAAAMQTIPSREGEPARSCPCGNKISNRDTHQICAACLGLRHAQAALKDPGSCDHCARFTVKCLRRRLARQVSLSGEDPLVSGDANTPVTQRATMPAASSTSTGLNWGDQLDALAPFPTLLDAEEDEVEGEEDDLDDGSEFLISDEDEEFQDSPFLPPAQMATLPCAMEATDDSGETPHSPFLNVDLQDVLKRAAEKLNIPWPAVLAETAKSRYEGKRLPRAKRAARQLLPIFPELMEELATCWKEKPFTGKTPIQGGSALDLEGMEKEGLLRMPPMEPLVAAHLHPSRSVASSPTLPSKADRFQSSMTDRAYKAVALSVRALNAISMLTAYQAELQDETSATPGSPQWEEICVITDLSLRLQRCAVQAAGKAMATMVVQERGRWLNLASLSDREKEAILDAPVVPGGIFGSALTLMQKRCEEKKRDDEALRLCLPRKPQPGPPSLPRPPLTQASSRPTASFRIPKRPKPQPDQPGQSGSAERKTVWSRKPQPLPQAAPPPPDPSARMVRRQKKSA